MRSKHLREVAVGEISRIYGTIKIDGMHCPVTNLFDASGDETDDTDEACSAVVRLFDGKWMSVCINERDIWPLQ